MVISSQFDRKSTQRQKVRLQLHVIQTTIYSNTHVNMYIHLRQMKFAIEFIHGNIQSQKRLCKQLYFVHFNAENSRYGSPILIRFPFKLVLFPLLGFKISCTFLFMCSLVSGGEREGEVGLRQWQNDRPVSNQSLYIYYSAFFSVAWPCSPTAFST